MQKCEYVNLYIYNKEFSVQENQAIWKLCKPCELYKRCYSAEEASQYGMDETIKFRKQCESIKKCYSAEEASQAAEEDEFHKAGFGGDEQRDHRWWLPGTHRSSF